MSKVKDPKTITSGIELTNLACKNGGYIDRFNGDHAIVKSIHNPGSVAIQQKKDIPVGTQRSILKQLAKIGIILTLLFVLYVYISIGI